MFKKILNSLRSQASNDDVDTRRSSERREVDHCVGMIDGKIYPIKNWSQGGVLLAGTDQMLGVNDTKDVVLKFKLSNRVVDVQHRGKILRKNNEQFVLQFSPLTDQVTHRFKQIVDDYITQEFMHSQQV